MQANITRDEAWTLLNEYNKEEFHIEHSLIVEGTMKYFAKELGYDAIDVGFTRVIYHDDPYPHEDILDGEDWKKTLDAYIEEAKAVGLKIATTHLPYRYDYTDTESYLEHVRGKGGGVSYSAMLQEYRETFLNIDMMIIDDLEPLFMGLW